MKKIILIIFVLFFVGFVSAECNESQIDINTASLTELDEIIHVGQTVAGYIIDARPFDSLDNLTKVQWLGVRASYIEDIKEQGLACVEETNSNPEEEQNQNDVNENQIDENPGEIDSNSKEIVDTNSQQNSERTPVTAEIIKLSPETKDIKSESNFGFLSRDNLPILGLVVFCFLLGFLFFIRRAKENKNEFR
ncbi:MAG: helix-hairpin-helix domain-containing protein [archaeon]